MSEGRVNSGALTLIESHFEIDQGFVFFHLNLDIELAVTLRCCFIVCFPGGASSSLPSIFTDRPTICVVSRGQRCGVRNQVEAIKE